MRLTNRLLLRTAVAGIVCLCSLSSCSDEPESVYGDPVPVVFSPRIAGETDIEVSSRVVNDTWSGGEIVGINMVAASSSSLAPDATFIQYKAAAGTTSVALTSADAATALYYPADGSNVNFFAFSPYKPPSSNQVTYSAQIQSTIGSLEAVDFIWAKAMGTYNKSNPTQIVNLAFTHKQVKVIVKVTAGTGVTATDIATSGATLTLSNMPYGASYNLSDGKLQSIVDVGTITPFKSVTNSDNVTWEAIVPPHSDTNYSNRRLNFTFNGKSYAYPLTDNYVAGNSYTYNLTLTTSGIVLYATTISDWTGGAVSWNGGKSVLHTTSGKLNFLPAVDLSQTLTIQYQGTTIPPVAVTSTSATNSEEGKVSWLKTEVATTTTTSSPWTQRTLTVTTTEENTGTAPRTGYIHVSLEGLSVVITVVQSNVYPPVSSGSNCYMVAPGGTVAFPVTRAITIGGALSTATFTVAKLWDDTNGGAVSGVFVRGTGSNAVIFVTAGSNPGNAVVAAQVNGVTCWSWHIWVTDYSPWQGGTFTNTYNTNNGGSHFVFMDRNLGATQAGVGSGLGTGLFYQWGRKDPFPATLAAGTGTSNIQAGGGSFTALATNATRGTIANTIANPTVFYWGVTNSGNDWYWGGGSNGANRKNDLWGHGGSKSDYDPCPTGWRVPQNSTADEATSPWFGFNVTGSAAPQNLVGSWSTGYSWGTNAVYPAAGLRTYVSSELVNPGVRGYYWTASPSNSLSSTLASHMNFFDGSDGNGYINVYSNGSRSFGLSVRCVQE